MEKLGGNIINLHEVIIDSIMSPNEKDAKVEKDDLMEKDAKMEKDNTFLKPEDLDGLQMLRLVQDDEIFLNKDIELQLEESIDQDTFLEDCNTTILTKGNECNSKPKCFQMIKSIVHVVSHDSFLEEQKPPNKENKDMLNFPIEFNEKQKAVEKIKPSLIRNELGERHQEVHVKFALEGLNVEDKDEAKASKHDEFNELKRRLEEEEKIYAGCALGEASDIDQIEVDSNVNEMHNLVEDINSLEQTQYAADATMDEVLNNLEEVAISRQDLNQQEDMKPSHWSQNARFAMKGLIDDDGMLELQAYTNREGSTRCHSCCQKAGKQIDEGDESDVYMTNSSYSTLNIVCPISGIPVVELDDPVRSDECDHIYNRVSAINYITNMAKDGFCPCASPGCHALLSQSKLVVDTRLWQDIDELRQIKAAMWESRMLQEFANVNDSDDD